MNKLICLLFLFCIICIPSATAQDDTSPILELLSAVPDTLEARDSIVSFVDYRAMVEARAGAKTPESWDEFMNAETEEMDLYSAALFGIISGPDFLQFLFTEGGAWEETVGFNFFDIEQGLLFGNPPQLGNVLVGSFDVNTIIDAFARQGFTAETFNDYMMLCGEIGCDDGALTDFDNINRSNPFGGDLGRQEPILVSESLLLNSPEVTIAKLMEEAVTDEIVSLADNPTYIAATNSINPDNILIQAQFVYFTLIVPDVAMNILTGNAAEIEEKMEAFAGLPQYEVVMFADTATETEQVVYVSLVYNTLEAAELATEVIPTRLAEMESTVRQVDFQTLFDERGVTDIIATAVTDEATGRALAILEFHAPIAPQEADPEAVFGRVSSSILYRLFIDMLYARDTDWLIASGA